MKLDQLLEAVNHELIALKSRLRDNHCLCEPKFFKEHYDQIIDLATRTAEFSDKVFAAIKPDVRQIKSQPSPSRISIGGERESVVSMKPKNLKSLSEDDLELEIELYRKVVHKFLKEYLPELAPDPNWKYRPGDKLYVERFTYPNHKDYDVLSRVHVGPLMGWTDVLTKPKLEKLKWW
jgi:hypothetical protein